MTTATKMVKVTAVLKRVKTFDNGHGVEGFGFFTALAGLDIGDAHFDIKLLRHHGFRPSDFVEWPALPAVIDFVSDKDGSLHATKIYEINGQAAGDPLSETAVASAEESTEVATASPAGVQVGDKFTSTFKFGYQDFGKFAEIAFFMPLSGPIDDLWDILVPLDAINDTQLTVLRKDPKQQFVIEITAKSDKGYVGRVDSLKLDTAAIKQQIAEREADKADKRAEREAKRQEAQKRILGRGQIVVTQDGNWKLFGVPVTEAEWPKLPDGTFVVLVEQFDDETGNWSGLVSHFQVGKPGGQPRKLNEKMGVVLWEEPVEEGWKPFVPIDTALCSVKAGAANVAMPLFEETDRARVTQLIALLRAGRLKVNNRPVDEIVLVAGGQYAILGKDEGPLRQIEKPQLLSALQSQFA